jgi:hypothetical protein
MAAPGREVVEVFGGDGAQLVALAGGRGTAWRSIVLKPGIAETDMDWLAHFVDALDTGGRFRVAKPVRTTEERWTYGGWSATEWLDGEHVQDAWDRVLDVSALFHAAAAAVAGVEVEPVVNATDPWSRGHRVAWMEEHLPIDAPASVREVFARVEPLLLTAPAGRLPQIIHADLGGNVLFADDAGLAPAVIDISPAYRPASYADAIIVADAVAWSAASLTLALHFAATHPDGDELLARAILFRVATAMHLWPAHPARVEAEAAGYASLLPALKL